MRIQNLSKYFGNKVVLSNVNLTVNDGEILCVMGGSGTGKTTILNAISGLIDYEGSIDPVTPSYIFQTDRLIPGITVRKNLELVMNESLTSEEKTAKINEMLSLAGLGETADMLPTALSGGMAQRVAFVRAFLYESDVVLMDEPFRSLDLATKRVMSELFFRLLGYSSRKVVFVTHDVDEALYIGDKVAVLKDGKIDFEIMNSVPRAERKFYDVDASARKRLVEAFI